MSGLTPAKIKKLLASGNWMIRMDNDGVSYNGFKWAPLGRWTTAPDWNTNPICSNGLFGQNEKGNKFCRAGSRLVLCETKGQQIIVDGEKIKVQSAKIIAIDSDIPVEFVGIGSLDLEGYNHPLPASLASVGGSLDLEGYNHPLPASLASVGGSLDLRRYNHPLPASLASVGGFLYLEGYNHPLPDVLRQKIKGRVIV